MIIFVSDEVFGGVLNAFSLLCEFVFFLCVLDKDQLLEIAKANAAAMIAKAGMPIPACLRSVANYDYLHFCYIKSYYDFMFISA